MQQTKEVIRFFLPTEALGELSNFFPLKEPIQFQGKPYKTSEHLYQTLKFLYDGANEASLVYAELIRTAKTPYIAKILANQAVGDGYQWRTALNDIIKEYKNKGAAQREDWEDIKLEVMRTVLKLKFSSDSHCRKMLLETGDNLLEENSPHDYFWGSKGKNALGKLLQEIRDDFKKKQSPLPLHQLSRTENNRLKAVALLHKRKKITENDPPTKKFILDPPR